MSDDTRKRRYRYKDDREAQAAVEAASDAWRETFARYYHIPGTEKVLRIGPPRTTRLPAPWARQHRGAIYGRGEGLQGNSYAIPTKDARLNSLPLGVIETYVSEFIAFARMHPSLVFQLTPIGCGLAGYLPGEIAPMFADAPSNVVMPPEFAAIRQQATP